MAYDEYPPVRQPTAADAHVPGEPPRGSSSRRSLSPPPRGGGRSYDHRDQASYDARSYDREGPYDTGRYDSRRTGGGHSYDRGYGGDSYSGSGYAAPRYGGGGYGGGYGGGGEYRGRSRSPPRRRHEITKASEELRKTSTCLYVGNLPYSFREEDVSELFDRYGRLRNVSVPQDRLTGRNKGFAFVTFEDRRDAEDAKHKYDQSTVEGRRLRIDWDVGRDLKGLDNAPRPPIRDEASFASSRYP
ncbi:hypothetical protein HDU90_008452 [Geranomyces variabilis]|nr:hypothetical protein HDU90_008452 [Geranomyces variabilis]